MAFLTRKKKAPLWGLFCALSLLFNLPVQADKQSSAIASASPLATEAGMRVLQQGGNAFDAAVTVSAVLAVVEPYSSGFGGGGFWLLHRANDRKDVMIDGREKAPLAAHKDMYLDASGQVDRKASVDGPLAAGIPGQAAALVHMNKHYGILPLRRLLEPAIALAEKGFSVDAFYQRMVSFRLSAIQQSPAASVQFLENNDIPSLGYRIVQPDLASTLRALASKGHDGFYRGQVAQKMVDSTRENGGIWTMEDLAKYQVVERAPIIGQYKNYRIVSAAPPSSGGVVLVNMLQALEGFDLEKLSESERIHLIVEVMRRAYEDRANYLGDSDFVDMPLERLTSSKYARERADNIRFDQASKSQPMSGVGLPEGQDTTHFSVLDKNGNHVSATLSINYPFGSGFVAEGTGILLNDEMDDFSAQPGVPNVYGLVGNEANAIAPEKRMLSSMTPTYIEGNDRLAILGTPGGSRIISMVLLAALEAMDGKPVSDWVNRPRFHHQYLPDVVQHESAAFTPETQNALQKIGHKLQEVDSAYGNMHAILLDKKSGRVSAASDKRGGGQASVQ